MVNILKLKGKLVESDTKPTDLAVKMGIDVSTLYRRFKEPTSFTVEEVDKIVSCLGLSEEETLAIFLCPNSLMAREKV